jgi:hypothetical protein
MEMSLDNEKKDGIEHMDFLDFDYEREGREADLLHSDVNTSLQDGGHDFYSWNDDSERGLWRQGFDLDQAEGWQVTAGVSASALESVQSAPDNVDEVVLSEEDEGEDQPAPKTSFKDVDFGEWNKGVPSEEDMDQKLEVLKALDLKGTGEQKVLTKLAEHFGVEDRTDTYELLKSRVSRFVRRWKEIIKKREREATGINEEGEGAKKPCKAKVPLEEFLEDLLLYALPNKCRGVLENLSKKTKFATEAAAILQDADGVFYVEISSLLNKNNPRSKKTLLKRIGAAMELKDPQSMKVQVEYVLPMLEAFFKLTLDKKESEFKLEWEVWEAEHFEECKIPLCDMNNFRAMIEKVYVEEVSEGSWLDEIDRMVVKVEELRDVAQKVGLLFTTPEEFLERLKKSRRGLVFRVFQLLKPVQPAGYVAPQSGNQHVMGTGSEGNENAGANLSNRTVESFETNSQGSAAGTRREGNDISRANSFDQSGTGSGESEHAGANNVRVASDEVRSFSSSQDRTPDFDSGRGGGGGGGPSDAFLLDGETDDEDDGVDEVDQGGGGAVVAVRRMLNRGGRARVKQMLVQTADVANHEERPVPIKSSQNGTFKVSIVVSGDSGCGCVGIQEDLLSPTPLAVCTEASDLLSLADEFKSLSEFMELAPWVELVPASFDLDGLLQGIKRDLHARYGAPFWLVREREEDRDLTLRAAWKKCKGRFEVWEHFRSKEVTDWIELATEKLERAGHAYRKSVEKLGCRPEEFSSEILALKSRWNHYCLCMENLNVDSVFKKCFGELWDAFCVLERDFLQRDAEILNDSNLPSDISSLWTAASESCVLKRGVVRGSSKERVGNLSYFRVGIRIFVVFEDTRVGLWACMYKVIGLVHEVIEKSDEIILKGSFEKKPIGLISDVFGKERRRDELRLKGISKESLCTLMQKTLQ